MRLVTWNVNSIRKRMDHLTRLVQLLDPDVIALQETKVTDDLFPRLDCHALGYPHQAIKGQKSYNGVAILSKYPLDEVYSEPFCRRDDCRHVSARVKGVQVHSLYIPAGGDKPNPAVNPKFQYKLDFFDALQEWFRTDQLFKTPSVLMGDFNVAPLKTDVWSHERLKSIITHTPLERQRLTELLEAGAWTDAARHFVPETAKVFTWWSYRGGGGWQEGFKGRRLDHIWTTGDLVERYQAFSVFKEARAWPEPSDHAPVVLDLERESPLNAPSSDQV